MAVIHSAVFILVSIVLSFARPNSSPRSIETSAKAALYKMEYKGYRFVDGIIRTIENASLVRCGALCLATEGCDSFQYCYALPERSPSICEILESGFNRRALPSLDIDFNVYSSNSFQKAATMMATGKETSGISTETTISTTALETTMSTTAIKTETSETSFSTTLTSSPSECPPPDASTVKCTSVAGLKTYGSCAYKTSDKKITINIHPFDQQSWNAANEICIKNKQNFYNINDTESECVVKTTMEAAKKASTVSMKNFGFPIGMQKKSNDTWKYLGDANVVDFPPFFVGNGAITDELCAYLKVVDEETFVYQAMPCNVNSANGIKLYVMCFVP